MSSCLHGQRLNTGALKAKADPATGLCPVPLDAVATTRRGSSHLEGDMLSYGLHRVR